MRRRRASLISCPSFPTARAAGTGKANDEWLFPGSVTSIYTVLTWLIVHYYGRYNDLSSRLKFAIMQVQLPLIGCAMKPLHTERHASRLIGDHVIRVSCQLHGVIGGSSGGYCRLSTDLLRSAL
jgi:hypothetical protein